MTVWESLQHSVLTTHQARAVDRVAMERYGMHSLVLMENAALGCARWLQKRFSTPQHVVLLCGSGNNGGDGVVLTRHLQVLEWPCRCLIQGPLEKLSSDNKANFHILSTSEVCSIVGGFHDSHAEQIASADVIVDAMLGTGASGDPRSPFQEWIELANQSQAFRLAIDVPTGLNAETGRAGTPCFKPHATLSFVARKPAMQREDVAELFGEIEILPIGLPQDLLREVLEWTRQ